MNGQKKTFPEINDSWTLFLDRDGVINRRIEGDYVRDTNTFEFLPGVKEALKNLSRIFERIVVVTNQQGIGKGVMSEEDLNAVHNYMLEEIQKEGGRIDRIYFCGALESSGDINRKPAPGMAWQARKDFPMIEFRKSIMVGDSLSDMKFGKYEKMITVYIRSEKQPEAESYKYIDFSAASLQEFASWFSENQEG